jgi:nucleoside phosphorylase
MATTLYLFPTEFEAAPFRALRPDAQVRIIGVGMSQAAAATARLLADECPQRVVLCGIAGACNEGMERGSVVEVVEDSEYGLPALYAERYEPQRLTSLPAVKAFTVSRSGASVAEAEPAVEQMEGAAVGAMCRVWGVEYSHLRGISGQLRS